MFTVPYNWFRWFTPNLLKLSQQRSECFLHSNNSAWCKCKGLHLQCLMLKFTVSTGRARGVARGGNGKGIWLADPSTEYKLVYGRALFMKCRSTEMTCFQQNKVWHFHVAHLENVVISWTSSYFVVQCDWVVYSRRHGDSSFQSTPLLWGWVDNCSSPPGFCAPVCKPAHEAQLWNPSIHHRLFFAGSLEKRCGTPWTGC